MARISNRRYPSQKCKNPACKTLFEPHDRGQEYCGPQCRINANNDKRHLANNTRFVDEKQARLNNKILESIWRRLLNDKKKLISQGILEWEKFKFDSQASIKKNTQSNNNILWYYDYGLELVDPSKKLFELHRRS